MSAHRHRAVAYGFSTRRWTHCVAAYPSTCSGAPHGGVVLTDRCRCGATREEEVNGPHVGWGAWAEAPARDGAR